MNTFFSERYHRISARRGKKRDLITVAISKLTAAYLILSTGARYHELGAQYMQAKIEKKRKLYLTAELKKLGYKVSLEKKGSNKILSQLYLRPIFTGTPIVR